MSKKAPSAFACKEIQPGRDGQSRAHARVAQVHCIQSQSWPTQQRPVTAQGTGRRKATPPHPRDSMSVFFSWLQQNSAEYHAADTPASQPRSRHLSNASTSVLFLFFSFCNTTVFCFVRVSVCMLLWTRVGFTTQLHGRCGRSIQKIHPSSTSHFPCAGLFPLQRQPDKPHRNTD